MKQFLLENGSAAFDADLDVPDSIDPLELDLLRARTSDGSEYRAWEFDAVDTVIVDELSY
ncbi:hypothetical protein GCM10022381_17680 [Leifsonia kafniensis]|uniref:Uncharacterized protein n=1 Tax=Leifsonia kafniensis TaxID=475957 RepID=A0ABP7KF10_9MICO